jgi:hypothetical protein
MEVATRNMRCLAYGARLSSPRNVLPLSKEAAFADNTAGNTPPPPPFRRLGEVAEEGKEEVEPCVT